MIAVTCKVVASGDAYVGQQGFTYLGGLTGATVGSRGISMTVVTVAHTAPDDQEGIVLLPELDTLV